MTRPSAPPTSPYRVPLALGLATLVGLPAALVGEGAWDVASWIALSLPLIALVARVRPR